jgi:hypothetical protein
LAHTFRFNDKPAFHRLIRTTQVLDYHVDVNPRLKTLPRISQDDLAGKLAAKGVSLDRSAISRIESQERYVMDYEALAVADCLNASVAWLFGRKA